MLCCPTKYDKSGTAGSHGSTSPAYHSFGFSLYTFLHFVDLRCDQIIIGVLYLKINSESVPISVLDPGRPMELCICTNSDISYNFPSLGLKTWSKFNPSSLFMHREKCFKSRQSLHTEKVRKHFYKFKYQKWILASKVD